MPRHRRDAVALPDGAVTVARSRDVPDGPPFRTATVAGRRLLLGRHPDGHVVAFAARCPHLGRPLRRAGLDGTVLTCRHHRHRYDLDDGRCVWPAGPRDDVDVLEVYETGEVDGHVWVRA